MSFMTDLSKLSEQLIELSAFDAQAPLNLSPIAKRHYVYCQGVDAEKFLQGQLTCNLKEVDLDNTRLGLHCSPQGRSLTSFRLSKQADEQYLFQCHQDLGQSFEQQLGKYMVFSKAEFASAQIQGLCLQGSQALDFVSQFWPDLTSANRADQQQVNQYGSCIQLDNAQQRFELWLQAEQLEPIMSAAKAQGAQLLTAAFYQWQLIQLGRAVLEQDSTETYVPQMLNYELINGISFNKGCYTGQEVVARAKYRGQVKRRLQRYLIEGATAQDLGENADICSEDAGSTRKAGQVVNFVEQPQGLEILAVIAVSQIDNTQLYLAHKQDKKLRALPLPYATFNTDENNQAD